MRKTCSGALWVVWIVMVMVVMSAGRNYKPAKVGILDEEYDPANGGYNDEGRIGHFTIVVIPRLIDWRSLNRMLDTYFCIATVFPVIVHP